MDKLDVVKYLLEEIEEEKRLFKEYEADREQARKQADAKDEVFLNKYLKYKGRTPSKSRIKDNCKKIRQIMQDISNEVI